MRSSASKTPPPIVAGLDIGSTKVALVIGRGSDANTANTKSQTLEILGIGRASNAGIKQGIVVNIEATTAAIRKAREEAELMAGYRIHEVLVSVSGSHIKSFDSRGMIPVRGKDITYQDIEKVIEAAKAVVVPTDRSVLHVIPREFQIDDQDGILNPLGMSGVRLESNVHIVTGGQMAIANNLKCLEGAGLKLKSLVLDPLAASLAVLSEDEKSLGVCLVDMGGSSCHLIYYINGAVAQISTLPIGGFHFTQDIAIGLRTPQVFAENLKKKYGCALSSMVGEDEVIEVEGVGGRRARTISRRNLAEIIEARADETLQLIWNEISHSGLVPLLGAGIVITGGLSQLDGLNEMGEFLWDLPVRRGTVEGLGESLKSPDFSTSAGLLIFGWQNKKYTKATASSSVTPLSGGGGGRWGIKSWDPWLQKAKQYWDLLNF